MDHQAYTHSRLSWLPLWAAAAFLLLLAGCTAPPVPPAATGAAIVRIGQTGSPDSLNPGAAMVGQAYTLFDLVYDSMFQLQLDGSFTPELAESYSVTDDHKVWTFKLRDGVRFHDGRPLTAEDVAFSYNLYKEREDFPLLHTYTSYFDAVAAPDPATVVITLTEAIPNMESQLMYQYVLPKHIWEQYDGDALLSFENREMVGSGPFKLVEHQPNQFSRLDAVKDHFLNPPQIDGVVIQAFDNQDVLVQALRTGQVDMITEAPAAALAGLRNAQNIALAVGPPIGPSVTDIMINQVAPENCPPDIGKCSGHPALRDRNVRLALAHATDKQKIIDLLLLGLGEPGATLIPDSLGSWYNSSLQDYAYDVAEANRILDGAGYEDGDGDGIREMPDGSQPLTFRVYYPSGFSTAARMADLLAAQWQQAGIGAQVQGLEPDALGAMCCPTFDYDIMLWGWQAEPDPSSLLSIMTTDGILMGGNETGYSNPRYDELFRAQGMEFDPARRKEMIWEMQKIVHDDVVYIVPYYGLNAQAYRTDRFQGWVTDASKLELADPSSLTQITPVE